jgi:hypothetical protein
MNRTHFISSTLLLLAAACGGVVNQSQEGSAAGVGGSGATGPGSTTSGTGAVSVGEGGSTTSSVATGPGGAPACYESGDAFTMDLSLPNGPSYNCNGGATGSVEFEAAVVSGDSNGWTLDLCSPAADCLPEYAKLGVAAADLYVYLPVGGYVRVRADVEQPWGCTQMLQIDNISSWDGSPNPVAKGDFLWLAAADGTPTAFEGAPFTVTQIAQGCYPNEPPGCGPHEDYTLLFADAKNSGKSAVVAMGQLGYLETSSEYWSIRNLRSFETGNCDDYWNWGYWLAPQVFDTGED